MLVPSSSAVEEEEEEEREGVTTGFWLLSVGGSLWRGRFVSKKGGRRMLLACC